MVGCYWRMQILLSTDGRATYLLPTNGNTPTPLFPIIPLLYIRRWYLNRIATRRLLCLFDLRLSWLSSIKWVNPFIIHSSDYWSGYQQDELCQKYHLGCAVICMNASLVIWRSKSWFAHRYRLPCVVIDIYSGETLRAKTARL